MELVQLHGAAAAAVQQRVEDTQAYAHFEAYFAVREIAFDTPTVYQLTGDDDAVLIQYPLTGLADNASGVVELSLRGNTVVRTFALIEYYAADGTVETATRFRLTDTRGIRPVRKT